MHLKPCHFFETWPVFRSAFQLGYASGFECPSTGSAKL